MRIDLESVELQQHITAVAVELFVVKPHDFHYYLPNPKKNSPITSNSVGKMIAEAPSKSKEFLRSIQVQLNNDDSFNKWNV